MADIGELVLRSVPGDGLVFRSPGLVLIAYEVGDARRALIESITGLVDPPHDQPELDLALARRIAEVIAAAVADDPDVDIGLYAQPVSGPHLVLVHGRAQLTIWAEDGTRRDVTAADPEGDSGWMELDPAPTRWTLGRPGAIGDRAEDIAEGESSGVAVLASAATSAAPPAPEPAAAAPPSTPEPTAVAPTAEPAAEADGPPVDEDAQFTVYRPRVANPDRWHRLLVFVHKTDVVPGVADPVEEVERQAEQVLGLDRGGYRALSQDSEVGLPRGDEILLVPEIDGVEFNPTSRSFRWLRDVHREEFDFRVDPDRVETTVRGQISVYVASVLIAEIKIAMRVRAADHPTEEQVADQATPYRRIFASYSHEDHEVVARMREFAGVMGDEFIRDVTHLRTGEVWSESLERMIREADVFQLFWSQNSMHSPYVRAEYDYALGLGRANFVRPVYWQEPMPQAPNLDLPPESLRALHFCRLPARGEVGPSTPAATGDASEPSEAIDLRTLPPPASVAPPAPPVGDADPAPAPDGGPAAPAAPPPPPTGSQADRPRRKRSLAAVPVAVLALGALALGIGSIQGGQGDSDAATAAAPVPSTTAPPAFDLDAPADEFPLEVDDFLTVEAIPPATFIPEFGTVARFDGLAERCFADDLAACDLLYRVTPIADDLASYEGYGITCGGRREPLSGTDLPEPPGCDEPG